MSIIFTNDFEVGVVVKAEAWSILDRSCLVLASSLLEHSFANYPKYCD